MNQKLNAHLKIKNVIILNKLRSKFYEDTGYIDWDNSFEPKK